MKSGLRGLLVALLLFFLWGTEISGPFRYFSYALENSFLWIFNAMGIYPVFQGFIVPVLMVAILILLLRLCTKKFASYTAGVCALLSLVYYLITYWQTKIFDTVSFAVVIGLALALLFLLLKTERPGLWLCDAYLFAIPVLLFYDLLFIPLVRKFPAVFQWAEKVLAISNAALSSKIPDILGLPSLVWSAFLFIVIAIPVVFYSKDRKNG